MDLGPTGSGPNQSLSDRSAISLMSVGATSSGKSVTRVLKSLIMEGQSAGSPKVSVQGFAGCSVHCWSGL